MKRTFAFPVLLLWGWIAGAQAPHQATEERPHMEHRFDPAQSARSLENPERDAWQKPDQVLAVLELKPGQIVADIGAGTGYFSVRLARAAAAPKVYAADIEPRMVDYLRQRAEKEGLKNVTAILASETSANLPEPVDCVLIVNTYHHIGQRVNYFRLLAKSLRPGGRIAIIDFKKGAPGGPPDHFRFTAQEIQTELARAGFELQVQHDFLPNQMFLIFRRTR
jgi:cyclopropane fatty-acyl-phospholipid synthase-like methyltransferase